MNVVVNGVGPMLRLVFRAWWDVSTSVSLGPRFLASLVRTSSILGVDIPGGIP